jgi:hypothetical protein
MAVKDSEQLRAWCIDYSLRLGAPKGRLRPETVIKDAAKIEQWVTGRPKCEVTLLKPRPKRTKKKT